MLLLLFASLPYNIDWMFLFCSHVYWWIMVVGLPQGLSSKEFACSAEASGDMGSIPGWGRYPGEGHGSPLQYSCLENSMDRGVWQSMGSQRVRHDWVINTDTPQTLPTIPPTPCWQWFLCVPSYFCFIRRHPSTACNTISNKRPA